MSLLEGLLAILIFSVGILALVALQATSVRATTDAKLRADASFMASQLDRRHVDGFLEHRRLRLQRRWRELRVHRRRRKRGGQRMGHQCSSGTARRIRASTYFGVNNLVTISICWPSGDPADPWRRYQTVTQINL